MMHVCVCGEEGYSRVYLKRLSDLLSLLQKVHREGQVSLFQSAIACAGNLFGLFDVKKEIIIFSIMFLYLRAKMDENVQIEEQILSYRSSRRSS